MKESMRNLTHEELELVSGGQTQYNQYNYVYGNTQTPNTTFGCGCTNMVYIAGQANGGNSAVNIGQFAPSGATVQQAIIEFLAKQTPR